MKKRKRKALEFNGTTHKMTAKARERVLKEARRKGFVTNYQACVIGRWQQAYYHLRAMVQAGLLKKDQFNRWIPR